MSLSIKNSKNIFELDYYKNHHEFIAATDEVGRGPLAGPVVATCIAFSGSRSELALLVKLLKNSGVDDSKKISEKKRKKILLDLNINSSKKSGSILLGDFRMKFFTIEKDHDYIDSHNILKSSLDAMACALAKLRLKNGIVLIDGNKVFEAKSTEAVSVIKGDSKSSLIGLASLIAKDYRDDLMLSFSKKYPYYGFEKNAGYPTALHRKAIEIHGISPIHRKSFKGVKEFVNASGCKV